MRPTGAAVKEQGRSATEVRPLEYISADSGRPPRTSHLLTALAESHAHDRITLGEIVKGLGDRAFGILLFAFAAPNLPPLGVPGISSVCAVPLIVLSLQLVLGRREPSLPRWLLLRSMPTRSFQQVVTYVVPWLRRVERGLKPRLALVTSRTGERAIGVVVLVLASVLMLPIPLGNLLPALAIAMLGLAVIERDGLAAVLGHLMAIPALAVALGVVIGSAELAVAAWQFIFGP
jgi:hypothetical protein